MTHPGTALPTGTVTFVFTDIEGSTRLLQELGEGYRAVQDEHDEIMRTAITDEAGIVVRTEGDSFFAVFPTPAQAVRATVAAQQAIHAHNWPEGVELRVRMGIHTGEGTLGGDDYLGLDVNRAARIGAAGHGGQLLVSGPATALIEHSLPAGVELRDLGSHRLQGSCPSRAHLPGDDRRATERLPGASLHGRPPQQLATPAHQPGRADR